MYGFLGAIGLLTILVIRFIIVPVVAYLRDTKGLRRYPNLTWCAGITDWPYVFESMRGHRSRHLAELHKTHPVIRIGPNSLSYGDARAVKDIYGHGTKCTKDDFYSNLAGTHFNLADVIDKHEHTRKRKVLASAYAIKHLEDWEFKVSKKVERLIMKFDEHCAHQQKEHPLIDFRAWSNFFTMDAIADIGLSSTLGFLEKGSDVTTSEGLDGTKHEVSYRDALHSSLLVSSHFVWLNKWYKTATYWARTLSRKYKDLDDRGSHFDGIVYHQTQERLQRYRQGEKLDDFFQALMEDKHGKANALPLGEIVAEINIMMNAGSVSTAIAINNALYMLLKNPKALEKLRNEIDAVADEDDTAIPYEKLKNLPYLRACLDESMRIIPPTPFGLPRKTPEQGCNILGEWIAGNTTVSMSAYVVHRDERVFEEPEAFRPERWLGEEGKNLQPYFITFSAGARGCIGRNISYLEQVVLIASVVHRYDFALLAPDWIPSRFEHFNEVPESMEVKVCRRAR